MLRTIPVRDGPDIITMDEAGGRVFVAHDGGTLVAIDAASGTVLGYTDVGSLPFQVVVDRKTGLSL